MEGAENVPRRHRSPSFPAVSLPRALDRARDLFGSFRNEPVPAQDVLQAWGYRPKSSGGFQLIAALRQFGLIKERRGHDRLILLADEARELIESPQNRSSRALRVARDLAFNPPIHKEIWEIGLPIRRDPDTFEYLVLHRGFSVASADELISEFSETLRFVEIDPGRGVPEGGPADVSESDFLKRVRTYGVQADTRKRHRSSEQDLHERQTVDVPIGPSEIVSLSAAFPLSEDEWERMLGVLKALKPSLVQGNAGTTRKT